MKVLYNNVDIYPDVSTNYCVHEMFAEKQSDSLVMRFNDTKGIWSKWRPAEGDEIRFQEGAADTGRMFVHSMTAENGLYTIRALSLPLSGKTKRSRSWEGVRFFQIANTIANTHGLSFKSYGCTDQVYPYLVQDGVTDFKFLSDLCRLEGFQMLIYDGTLIVYSEQYIESLAASGSALIDKNGKFFYQDNRSACYGSCEIVCGNYVGTFTAPESISGTVLHPVGIRARSNGEAGRFAKGLLRNANKYGRTGRFTKSLLTGIAPATLLQLETTKASAWNGTVFVYRVRHDYVRNQSTIYFRDVLEGY